MIASPIQSKMFVFPSGIQMVYHHSPGAISHCGIMIGAGSRHEPEGKSGLAHFIEHVIVKVGIDLIQHHASFNLHFLVRERWVEYDIR